jgi:hypothetical protein
MKIPDLPLVIAQSGNIRAVLVSHDTATDKHVIVIESMHRNAMKETVWVTKKNADESEIIPVLVSGILRDGKYAKAHETQYRDMYRYMLVSLLKRIMLAKALDRLVAKDREWSAFA